MKAKFRARARAVDMLGRQQIASIPTAISELFKNAYDAYATAAVIDLFRSDRMLVLRDDGVGMTEVEFTERWLTLGTEAKVDSHRQAVRPPPGMALRPVMGEKGIGRLAIAAIGPQVLVLTRSSGDPGSPLLIAFVNWSLFECIGINLDDVEVPVRLLSGGTMPTSADVQELVGQVRQNVDALENRIGAVSADRIRRELSSFRPNPAAIYRRLGAPPSLDFGGTGTHFIIQPTDYTLDRDLDDRKGPDEASAMERFLLGFTNTMSGQAEVTIKSEFFDHRGSGLEPVDIIGPRQFWTPDDLASADHHVSGAFDEYGQFRGKVSVYGQEQEQYFVPWSRSPGRATSCGPFKIEFGYVQGRAAESRLPRDRWAVMTAKLNRIAGLYVYRDGVRVLPYGSGDYDWLDIETKRSKSAAYYFFSYRRMLGAVAITRARNSELQEKAGREGFRHNGAYRDLTEILKNFLDSLAADFFREAGVRATYFFEQREAYTRAASLRARRERTARGRRQAFIERMNAIQTLIDAGEPQRDARLILQALGRELVPSQLESADDRLAVVVLHEATARRALAELRERYTVAKPRSVSLSRSLLRDLEGLSSELLRLEQEVFGPTAIDIDRLTTEAAGDGNAVAERRRLIGASLQQSTDAAIRRVRSEATETRAVAAQVGEVVAELARDVVAQVANSATEALTVVASTNTEHMDIAALAEFRARIDASVEATSRSALATLTAARSRLSDLLEDAQRGDLGTDPDELVTALEEEIAGLRDQADEDLELAQLGLAIDVVNHEFLSTGSGIRRSLDQLRPWGKANPELGQTLDRLRSGFEHLDSYLEMFTPLHRRLNREKDAVAGFEIYKFLQSLFRARLERHGIRLDATPAFQQSVVVVYRSMLYPVFVNLVDNALFWVKARRGVRQVIMDYRDRSYIVRDNGPGIPARDLERIFDYRFTKKPGGRGLGLHISRQVLDRAGWAIEALPDANGAVFRLFEKPRSDNEDDDGELGEDEEPRD